VVIVTTRIATTDFIKKLAFMNFFLLSPAFDTMSQLFIVKASSVSAHSH